MSEDIRSYNDAPDLDPATMELQVRQQVWLLSQPVDFDEAERNGLLLRRGAWYEVPHPKELPEHIAVKIRELKNENGKLLVKIPASVAASQRLAAKIGVDWKGPKPS